MTTSANNITNNEYDICISFDMTCSMRPCLNQVREELSRFLDNIHRELPKARLGIITHGDYDSSLYVTRHMNFTNDMSAVQTYISNVETAGDNCWNEGEAYEKVLNVAKTMTWSDTAQKILIVIGDDIPHTPMYSGNKEKLDWRKELQDLHKMDIVTYGVHAPTLSRVRAHFFYSALSQKSLNGEIIPLNQFIYIVDILLALIYKQHGTEMVEGFEERLETEDRYNRNMEIVFNHILERPDENKMGHTFPTNINTNTGSNLTASDLVTVPPTRFQILNVLQNVSIKQFVEHTGADFKAGKGYYQLSKSEKISQKKQIVLQHITSGSFFTGNAARSLLGLSTTGTQTKKPTDVPSGYVAFIQSSSYNRKLIANTKFLYDTQ